MLALAVVGTFAAGVPEKSANALLFEVRRKYTSFSDFFLACLGEVVFCAVEVGIGIVVESVLRDKAEVVNVDAAVEEIVVDTRAGTGFDVPLKN